MRNYDERLVCDEEFNGARPGRDGQEVGTVERANRLLEPEWRLRP